MKAPITHVKITSKYTSYIVTAYASVKDIPIRDDIIYALAGSPPIDDGVIFANTSPINLASRYVNIEPPLPLLVLLTIYSNLIAERNQPVSIMILDNNRLRGEIFTSRIPVSIVYEIITDITTTVMAINLLSARVTSITMCNDIHRVYYKVLKYS